MHVIHRTYISQIEQGRANISIDNIAPQGHFTTGTRIPNPSPHFVYSKKLAHGLGLTVSDLLRPPNGALDQNTRSALRGPGNGETQGP